MGWGVVSGLVGFGLTLQWEKTLQYVYMCIYFPLKKTSQMSVFLNWSSLVFMVIIQNKSEVPGSQYGSLFEFQNRLLNSSELLSPLF